MRAPVTRDLVLPLAKQIRVSRQIVKLCRRRSHEEHDDRGTEPPFPGFSGGRAIGLEYFQTRQVADRRNGTNDGDKRNCRDAKRSQEC